MQAVEMLMDSSATEKDIVLLSDGECLMQDEDATKIAYTAYQSATVQAVQSGIRIHVIGLGEEMEDIENSIFQAAAKTNGGVYFHNFISVCIFQKCLLRTYFCIICYKSDFKVRRECINGYDCKHKFRQKFLKFDNDSGC